MPSPIEVLLCYAEEDELQGKEIARHLGVLKRQDIINFWHDRQISAGAERVQEIYRHLNTAHIILLLISQYFMDSDFCYVVEMRRAIERHERGEARVIPVILRPVFFQRAPIARLQALPTNGKPIIGSGWSSLDEAFFDVAEGIRKVAEQLASGH
jgi:hypothetical protein